MPNPHTFTGDPQLSISLHSDLRFNLSFPSFFINNLSGGEEPHNVIEDGHR